MNISKVIETVSRYGFEYAPIVKIRYPGVENIIAYANYGCSEGMYIHQIRNGKLIAYYYYPTTGKWRAKGKTKYYRSKSVQHLMDILFPRSSKIDNLLNVTK